MKTTEPDLIDQIADALLADVRADFYREMRHCRSLPDNDEMLRILRTMQFLTPLMEQIPTRIGIEREPFEQLIGIAAESLRRSLEWTEAHRDEIDKRLTGLPDKIARGISPEIMAHCDALIWPTCIHPPLFISTGIWLGFVFAFGC